MHFGRVLCCECFSFNLSPQNDGTHILGALKEPQTFCIVHMYITSKFFPVHTVLYHSYTRGIDHTTVCTRTTFEETVDGMAHTVPYILYIHTSVVVQMQLQKFFVASDRLSSPHRGDKNGDDGRMSAPLCHTMNNEQAPP
jgi:hypothetical protein